MQPWHPNDLQLMSDHLILVVTNSRQLNIDLSCNSLVVTCTRSGTQVCCDGINASYAHSTRYNQTPHRLQEVWLSDVGNEWTNTPGKSLHAKAAMTEHVTMPEDFPMT